MKRLLSVLAIIATFALFSYQQQPTYKLKLTDTEMQVVLSGLSKLPYEQSAGVIQKIIGQAQDTAFQRK